MVNQKRIFSFKIKRQAKNVFPTVSWVRVSQGTISHVAPQVLRRLVCVYTVCSDVSVPIIRVYTV